MDIDIKVIASTALQLWIKLELLTMDEFVELVEKDSGELLDLLNSRLDKLDTNLLKSKIKECMTENK